MENKDIICKIYELINNCKSPFLIVHIRFLIDNIPYVTVTIKRGGSYSYKSVSFGNDLHCLLNNNFHFNCFDFVSSSFKEGNIECHGHGEFFGTDKLVITFNRSSI